MAAPRIVSEMEWLEARRELLAKEKALTKLKDQLARARREQPWHPVRPDYSFQGESGSQSLADLFADKSQLLIYHFMFGPDWEQGCPSCSFWADNFNGLQAHLAQRDIRLIAVSRAPLEKLLAYRKRMGWSFDWYSSLGSEFNHDFQVSFSPEEMARGDVFYNFSKASFPSEEAPGISVFVRDDSGQIFHTFSCYGRGLDVVNAAYQFMDLTPKGRDEDALPYTMAWLKRHDEYEK